MSNPDAFVLCERSDKPAGIPNSRQAFCHRCGSGVWMSDGTLRTVIGMTFQVVCPECFTQIEAIEEMPVMQMSEHQLAEIPTALHDEVKRYVEFLGTKQPLNLL